MRVEVQIDSSCREPRIVVVTDRMTGEIAGLVQRLSGEEPRVLAGFREGALEVLEETEILRVYASAGRVIAATERGEYTLRLRLYEAEARLPADRFVRISHSEIVNLKKVRRFDLSLAGTICVALTDGTVTYVSRRYVGKIRKVLRI